MRIQKRAHTVLLTVIFPSFWQPQSIFMDLVRTICSNQLSLSLYQQFSLSSKCLETVFDSPRLSPSTEQLSTELRQRTCQYFPRRDSAQSFNIKAKMLFLIMLDDGLFSWFSYSRNQFSFCSQQFLFSLLLSLGLRIFSYSAKH